MYLSDLDEGVITKADWEAIRDKIQANTKAEIIRLIALKQIEELDNYEKERWTNLGATKYYTTRRAELKNSIGDTK